jgi:hypothetical protein
VRLILKKPVWKKKKREYSFDNKNKSAFKSPKNLKIAKTYF